MSGSDSHANKLNFYLLSKRPLAKRIQDSAADLALKKGEVDFLKEIRKEKEEVEEEESVQGQEVLEDMEVVGDEEAADDEKKKGRKDMYRFFQGMRDIGLAELK